MCILKAHAVNIIAFYIDCLEVLKHHISGTQVLLLLGLVPRGYMCCVHTVLCDQQRRCAAQDFLFLDPKTQKVQNAKL